MTGEVFHGYERPDGSVGIRNYVAVIPTVACANGVAAAIARDLPGAVSLCHGHGCGRALEIPLHQRTLAGLGKNPNVAGVLIVGLGCETIKAEALALEVASTGKPVRYISIQDEGGSRKSTEKGIAIARELLKGAARVARKPFGFDRLILGLECGGSDAFSGVTANPGVGRASDWLASRGGTVLLTENTEMIGTSRILERRAVTQEVADKIRGIIADAEKRTHDILGTLAPFVIAPGNMDGGMTTIKEKSLGCIIKGGTSTITGVIDYAAPPATKGLVIMDGPGYDAESMAGLAAAGAQLIVFTTGRGNPTGFPLIPVIKVASTSRLYHAMEDDMDINAGVILEGGSLDDLGLDIIRFIGEVADGRQTKAEINRQEGILCMYSFTPAF